MKPAMLRGETSPIPARSLPSDVEEHLPATSIELAGHQPLGVGLSSDTFDDYADWCEEHNKEPLTPSVYFHRLKALGGGCLSNFRGIQSRNTGALSNIEQPYLGGGK